MFLEPTTLTSTSTSTALTTTTDVSTTTSLIRASDASSGVPQNATSEGYSKFGQNPADVAATVLGILLILVVIIGTCVFIRKRDKWRWGQRRGEAILLQHRDPHVASASGDAQSTRAV